ncbi:hypothetical protein [Spiroplasma sp. BIUS-1]|uniref:hypothetical protein n=1 Tax=Spiroplasma sp. BIUS-1 TaxID=216964 RepID=UPI0013991B9C|nr:hypothetical protein [Spiroplasma sp. BIUS-1]QHX36354.1 ABC transporter permease [Spiroplasma sp. BIUS-1]
MSQVNLNLVKAPKPKKIKSKKDENTFSGFSTLYLINIKRLLRNKAVIAMAIVSLLVTLIMSSLVTSFMKNPDDAASIGTIMVSIQFICEIFFFIIFMIILSSELIKKQLLEGIQNIEIRSGVSYKKSFLLRWYVFMTFVGGLALANSILKIAIGSDIIFKFSPFSLVILSTCVFYFFIGIVWTPVVFAVTILCSLAWSVMLNVFIAMLLVFSGMISSMDTIMEYDTSMNHQLVMKTNLKLSIANSFYETMKDDESNKIQALFKDENKGGKSILSYQLTKNASGLTWYTQDGKTKETIINSYSIYLYLNPNFRNNSEAKEAFSSSLYGGTFNIKVKSDAHDNKLYQPLLDTSIFNLLNDIFKTVEEGMKTNNNKPPLSLPGYQGGFMDENGYDSNFHDISPLIKWLNKQEKTKEYKNLLNWVDRLYSKYKFILPSIRERYYSSGGKDPVYEPFVFVSSFDGGYGNSIISNDENSDIYKVYKRYPELMIINDIITESWISTMISRAEYRYNSYDSRPFDNPREVYENYQDWTNSSILKNNLNIFGHFSILNSQLFGNNFTKDLLFRDSMLGYSGLTTGYKNLEDLASVDIRNAIDGEQPLTPIFENVQLSKKLGFIAPLAFAIYLLVGLGFTYLIYLLWARKAKI